jgi:hypothetical protein
MPIKRCTLPNGKKGYKWGNHGKCYSAKEQAEKQMKAAFANGYREKKNGN